MTEEHPEKRKPQAAEETPEEMRKRINNVAEVVVTAARVVSNTLGVGFAEKVYENALAHELRKAGVAFEQQYSIEVHYDGVLVGK